MPIATVRGVTMDCADPRALARFYQELTGMELSYDTDGFVALTAGSGCDLGFQRVHGYQAPQWPGQDVPQQFHLDLQVEGLDPAENGRWNSARSGRTTSRAATDGGCCWTQPVTRSA